MSIVKRKAGSKDIVKSVLEFDAVPTEGSHNLVESGAVAQAIGNLGQPLQWKGPATVSELNTGITGIQPGWTYTLTDAGTLTDGNVKVEAGDEVAWTEDDEWFQVGPSLVELKADVVQAKSDIADIQDVVPEEASESNKLVTKDELDNVQESIQSGFTPKGEISVSDLNDLTTQSNGDQYILTDSGTITDGSVTVEAGDSVAWNSTDSVWYKVNQYALSKYGTDEIRNLPTSITSFRSGDVIPVDGPSGTAKMTKDDLLARTAENALGSVHSLSETTTDFVSDDYILIDGAVNGSRKMAKDVLLDKTSQNAREYPSLEYENVAGLAVDGIDNFLFHGKFKRGLLNTSTGVINESFPFRVASETWFNFGKQMTVYIADGFQAGWLYESSGTYIFSGFKTASMSIPSGRTFRIAIRRATEDQSEIADIKEFGSAVTFLTKFGEFSKTFVSKEIIREKTSSIQPCFRLTKNVSEKLYVRAKVILPEDFHNPASSGFIDVLTIKGINAPSADACKVRLYKQTTATFSSDPKIPCPEYRSGIYATLDGYSDIYSRIIPDGYNNIVGIGKDVMSIRFTGDPTVEANQDLMLKIDDSSISIYHSTNNTNVVSYLKASYSTAREFYEAVLADTASGEVLEDFEITWWNLEGHTLSDFINCNVNLVAKYQSVKNGPYNVWRAFPFYFTTKDRDEHIVEVVFDKNASTKVQFILDGYGVEYPPLSDTVLNSIFNSNVQITFGALYQDTGTVDFVDYLVSDDIQHYFPLLRVFYAERLREGLTTSSDYYLSEDRLAMLAKVLHSHGYGDLAMQQVLEYVRGNNLDTKRYFHFTHDDTNHDSVSIMEPRVRETYLRCDITPSFGMMLNSQYSSTEIGIIKALRQCGWSYHIHDLATTVPGENLISLGLFDYDKMVSLVNDTIDKFLDTFGEFPLVWDFHEVSEGYNQVRYLINRGFQLIFGGNGYGSLCPANRYHCKRRTVRDSTDFATAIYPVLDNYLERKRP